MNLKTVGEIRRFTICLEIVARVKHRITRAQLVLWKNELSTTDSRIRSINASCGIELQTIGTPSAGKENNSSINQICALYRGYIGKLPFETLLKTCRQSMLEAECKQCLLEK